ncbi:MAG: aminotransferase class V-fold PLP-dependent enzyme [Candidatus Margulisiibacteriota bacterium]
MIYLNNAATTKDKPKEVFEAVQRFLLGNNVSPGRGADRLSVEADSILTGTRASLAKLFNAEDPKQIVFTLNCSDALNTAINGVLKPGDHVLITSIEHNSVVRPLRFLEKQGVEVEIVSVDLKTYAADPMEIVKRFKKNTKLVAMLHASNVIGAIQQIEEIGSLAKKKGILFLVDAAQTTGIYDIDVRRMNIDLLAFAGHKGLMGPQGTGGLYIKTGTDIKPFRYGGTGSQSELETQPEIMPDKFETGTPNTPGIAGLKASVEFILRKGTDKIKKHSEELTNIVLDELKRLERVKVYGPLDSKRQASVISFNIAGMEPKIVGDILEKKFGIIVRTGLHCSPLCHKTIGTFPKGTVRISMGYYNTVSDVKAAVQAVKEIALDNTRD